MEHRDDLEKLFLDGLTESEREQVLQAMADETAKRLRETRAQQSDSCSGPTPAQDSVAD
jgi:hypothetical protein